MKIIFYKYLLTQAKELSPAERIVYSFLVSKSITLQDCMFDVEGDCLNIGDLYDCVDDNPYLDLYPINNTQISKVLNISRKTAVRSIAKLKELGYITGNYIKVTHDLLCYGYFELLRNDILSGELLIFYSYIKNRAIVYNGVIDTFKTKLAECLDTTKIAITKLLNRLYELNLAKRLNNGKLMVL